MRFLLLIAMLLQGCATYRAIPYKEYSLNPWFLEPALKLVGEDKFRVLGEDNYYPVIKPYLEGAVADLRDQQVIQIDREKANILCQGCFKTPDNNKLYYLIRALNKSGADVGYELRLYENTAWISQLTVGPVYQVEKTAFVVRVDREIKQLYVSFIGGPI